MLVEPAFESNPAFYFPTREACAIATPLGQRDCRDAKVALADIPFVRLRDGLPRSLLDGHRSFSGVVRAAQKSVERPRVRLKVHNGSAELWLGDTQVRMSGVPLQFYLVLLRARVDDWAIHRKRDGERLAQAMAKAKGDLARDVFAREETRPRANVSYQDFDVWRSRCEKSIKEALGPSTAKPYLLQRSRSAPHTFSLAAVDKGAITLDIHPVE